MECATFDIDLNYERIHIAWARYGTMIILNIYLMGRNVWPVWIWSFSIGMMCSSGGWNGLSRCGASGCLKADTLVVKWEDYLHMELLVVSHARIMRFNITFIFEKPTSLLIRMDMLSIIYKEAFSGGSLVWYWYVQVVKCILWIVNECWFHRKLHGSGHMDDKLISKGSLQSKLVWM